MSNRPKEYRIETLEDILQLDKRQRESFMDDLKEWIKLNDRLAEISVDRAYIKSKGMIWIDDGDTGLKGVRITFYIDSNGDGN